MEILSLINEANEGYFNNAKNVFSELSDDPLFRLKEGGIENNSNTQQQSNANSEEQKIEAKTQETEQKIESDLSKIQNEVVNASNNEKDNDNSAQEEWVYGDDKNWIPKDQNVHIYSLTSQKKASQEKGETEYFDIGTFIKRTEEPAGFKYTVKSEDGTVIPLADDQIRYKKSDAKEVTHDNNEQEWVNGEDANWKPRDNNVMIYTKEGDYELGNYEKREDGFYYTTDGNNYVKDNVKYLKKDAIPVENEDNNSNNGNGDSQGQQEGQAQGQGEQQDQNENQLSEKGMQGDEKDKEEQQKAFQEDGLIRGDNRLYIPKPQTQMYIKDKDGHFTTEGVGKYIDRTAFTDKDPYYLTNGNQKYFPMNEIWYKYEDRVNWGSTFQKEGFPIGSEKEGTAGFKKENCGYGKYVKQLQSILELPDDTLFGPVTLHELQKRFHINSVTKEQFEKLAQKKQQNQEEQNKKEEQKESDKHDNDKTDGTDKNANLPKTGANIYANKNVDFVNLRSGAKVNNGRINNIVGKCKPGGLIGKYITFHDNKDDGHFWYKIKYDPNNKDIYDYNSKTVSATEYTDDNASYNTNMSFWVRDDNVNFKKEDIASQDEVKHQEEATNQEGAVEKQKESNTTGTLNLKLERLERGIDDKGRPYTLGKLYANDHFVSYTIENIDFGFTQQQMKDKNKVNELLQKKKQYSKSGGYLVAIPTGTYPVYLTNKSNKTWCGEGYPQGAESKNGVIQVTRAGKISKPSLGLATRCPNIGINPNLYTGVNIHAGFNVSFSAGCVVLIGNKEPFAGEAKPLDSVIICKQFFSIYSKYKKCNIEITNDQLGGITPDYKKAVEKYKNF